MQVLIDLLYHHSDKIELGNHPSDIKLEDLIRCEKNILLHCSVSEVSIILHIFHALGTLLGLALRNGHSPILRFPAFVYSILANEEVATTSPFFPTSLSSLVRSGVSTDHRETASIFSQEYEEYRAQMIAQTSSLKVLHSIALVLRFGICSIFPEVLFDLWTKEQIHGFFSGNPTAPCSLSSSISSPSLISVDNLIRLTTYDANINLQHDRFVHVSHHCVIISSISLIRFDYSSSGSASTSCQSANINYSCNSSTQWQSRNTTTSLCLRLPVTTAQRIAVDNTRNLFSAAGSETSSSPPSHRLRQ